MTKDILEQMTVKSSPFKVTFGEEPKIGLVSTIVPASLFHITHTEEDLKMTLDGLPKSQASIDSTTSTPLPQVGDNRFHETWFGKK